MNMIKSAAPAGWLEESRPADGKPLVAIRRGRFAPNLLTNVVHLGFSTLVGIWYVPFLVNQLGPASYGLVPLISSVTAYMLLITMSVNSAVARSMAMALEQGDIRRANCIFNTSLWGSVALCGILLILGVVGLIYLDHIIRIPPGYETEARWLCAGVIAAFLINEIKTPFDISSFCCNRFDLRNVVSFCEIVTRVGLVVLLFTVAVPAIRYVGLAIAAGSVVAAAGAVWLWRVLTPHLCVSLRHFDFEILKGLTRTGGWVVVSTLGSFLYLNLDLVLANHLFSAEQSGRYAAVLQLPFFLRLFANAVAGLFIPTMLALYARKSIEEMVVYLRRSIKFSGLVLALPIGLMCGFAEPLLRLWLGREFAYLSPLLFLMAFHLCVNLSMQPLYTLPLAADRVKVPGIVALGIGLANLLLALLLAGHFGWGVYGLAVPGAVMLTLRHLVFTPLYCARILNKPAGTFYREVIPTVLATAIAIGLCRLVLWQWDISHWSGLISAGLAISLLFAAIIFLLFLKPTERTEVRAMMAQFRPASAA